MLLKLIVVFSLFGFCFNKQTHCISHIDCNAELKSFANKITELSNILNKPKIFCVSNVCVCEDQSLQFDSIDRQCLYKCSNKLDCVVDSSSKELISFPHSSTICVDGLCRCPAKTEQIYQQYPNKICYKLDGYSLAITPTNVLLLSLTGILFASIIVLPVYSMVQKQRSYKRQFKREDKYALNII